jgi:TalC/MipB family fructose-6-phosphate aldolase
MKFYLDTAERPEAEALLRTGLFAGLTTNPTLLARSGVRNRAIPELVEWTTEAGAGMVFVQTWGATAAELAERGRLLRDLGANVVVKVPASAAGVEATRALASEGIPVLVTAVYSAAQALPAMAAGASYLAPYLGRMNDAGRDGYAEIAAMQRSITACGSPMKILVASLREPAQAAALAALGVSEFTLSPSVWRSFCADGLTMQAVEAFNADSASMD